MAGMTVLRTMLLWLLLLALPFQGIAQAATLCAPAAPVPVAAPHDHAAMMRGHTALAHDHAAMADAAPAHDHHDGGGHTPAKCGKAAACCLGAALAPFIAAPPALPPPPSEAIPFRAAAPLPVHLAALDRPPKSRLA
jgi:hypothetical protein